MTRRTKWIAATGGCLTVPLVVIMMFLALRSALGVGGPPSAATPTPTIAARPTEAAKPVVQAVTPASTPSPTEAPRAPTEAPSPPTSPPAAAPQRIWVTGAGADGVNMRAEPSTTAARVKGLKDGAELEIVGADREADGRAWRNVKDAEDGTVGWIAAEFSAASPPAPSALPPAEKPVAPGPPPAAAPKPVAPAPKPVAPPPGGTIICNDGSTWPGTTRQGACNRRGGIKPGY